MYFIVVKFPVKPELVDTWIDRVTPFTEATRNEPGNLWFEWSRSVEDTLRVRARRGVHRRRSRAAREQRPLQGGRGRDLPSALAATPKIVSRQVDGDGWDAMGELKVD